MAEMLTSQSSVILCCIVWQASTNTVVQLSEAVGSYRASPERDMPQDGSGGGTCVQNAGGLYLTSWCYVSDNTYYIISVYVVVFNQ